IQWAEDDLEVFKRPTKPGRVGHPGQVVDDAGFENFVEFISFRRLKRPAVLSGDEFGQATDQSIPRSLKYSGFAVFILDNLFQHGLKLPSNTTKESLPLPERSVTWEWAGEHSLSAAIPCAGCAFEAHRRK